jgi:hypothetical protein
MHRAKFGMMVLGKMCVRLKKVSVPSNDIKGTQATKTRPQTTNLQVVRSGAGRCLAAFSRWLTDELLLCIYSGHVHALN